MAAPSIMSGMTGATSGFLPAHLPKVVLSPSDIQCSIQAYEILLTTAKAYRNALATLAQTANAFGAALESCARLKGVDEACAGLLSAAGLQFLVANHQSVLSDTVYRSYEIPLRENLESFVQDAEQRREAYLAELARRKKLLADREKKHLALAHRNKRSLGEFRAALCDLTMLADDIDKLKSDYFFTSLGSHHETWHRVATRSGIVCKAELQLYGAIGLKEETMLSDLAGVADPWDVEARSGDDLFSIVPPQEILARPQSPAHETGLFASLLGTLEEMATPSSTAAASAGAMQNQMTPKTSTTAIAAPATRTDLFAPSPRHTGAGPSAVPVLTRFHAEQEQTPTRPSHLAPTTTKRASSALKRLSGERVQVSHLETPTRSSSADLNEEEGLVERLEIPLAQVAEQEDEPTSPYQDAEEPHTEEPPPSIKSTKIRASPGKPGTACSDSTSSLLSSGHSLPSTPVKSSHSGSLGTRPSQSSSARKLDFQREFCRSGSRSIRQQDRLMVGSRTSVQQNGSSPVRWTTPSGADDEAVHVDGSQPEGLDAMEGATSPESFDKHSQGHLRT